jgi:hypothetical protein
MLRSVFVVAGCITDVTFALTHAAAPESALWISGLSLAAAGAGCLLMARTISRQLAGLELPTVRSRS